MVGDNWQWILGVNQRISLRSFRLNLRICRSHLRTRHPNVRKTNTSSIQSATKNYTCAHTRTHIKKASVSNQQKMCPITFQVGVVIHVSGAHISDIAFIPQTDLSVGSLQSCTAPLGGILNSVVWYLPVNNGQR